mmetsp:Transcript_20603/g.31008  ORF Transcript_20603/g.31008 Transcript_20603/m.31008 type:complete len:164 (-) Transcript_20603:132-623(-)
MRVSVLTVGGTNVADLDAEAWWSLRHVLQRLGDVARVGCVRRGILHGSQELLPGSTLADIGVGEGARLTLVNTADSQVLTASGGAAKIWDTETGDCLRSLQGHRDTVTSAAFSPDGTLVLTASYDRTAKIWDAESGECLRSFEHDGAVLSARWRAPPLAPAGR